MIQLSKSAIAEIRRLHNSQPNEPHCLGISVKPGGCAQYYYVLEFVPNSKEGDRCVSVDGLSIVIQADSLPYLTGLTIDYSEDLMGGGFRFENPNATQSCGCGNSFTI